jgi:transcriptional regulator with XRE-family HTH domain
MQLQISAIQETNASSQGHARVFQQLLGEIEGVRLKRQEQFRSSDHPQLKRFTQQELNDEACSTYKNLLIGRSNRLPSRSMLMDIADYLECSLSERNDILLAAQYLPEQPELEGDALRQALEHAQQLMETLPYPAIVVTRTSQVQAANEFYLRLFELPPLDTISPHQRTTIDFLFNPDFGIHLRSTFNAEAHAAWEKHALYAVQSFKQINVLYQYDAWYQQLVKRWCGLTDFQEYWEKARETTRQEDAPQKVGLARMATTGEVLPIRTQGMLVSVSSKIYPAVAALLPLDEAARAVYASFGCATSWPSSIG